MELVGCSRSPRALVVLVGRRLACLALGGRQNSPGESTAQLGNHRGYKTKTQTSCYRRRLERVGQMPSSKKHKSSFISLHSKLKLLFAHRGVFT